MPPDPVAELEPRARTAGKRAAPPRTGLAAGPSAPWPAAAAGEQPPAFEAGAADLLGGWKRLGVKAPQHRGDLHRALVDGLPVAALDRLMAGLQSLRLDEVAVALGVSDRTLRRYLEAPQGTLPVDLGSRVWGLAALLAKAKAAMGDRAAAERWMVEPAWGLGDERPLDLLRTETGRALVDEFLERLLHGVYN